MSEEGLEKVLININKIYGEGSILKLGESPNIEVDAISTGSMSLDLALGVGGIPRGRVTEIYGPEASGKTTLCQHIVASAQKAGGVAAFIDMEHALDPPYAEKCGVDIGELYISQPSTGEQALEIAEHLIRSGDVAVVIIDSVAALVPRKELEGDMGDAPMAMQARLMSQALRKLAGVVKKSNTALVFTNQLREKIGVVFGNPETTSGGNALKYYASVRLDLRRVEALKAGTELIGIRARARVVKNKVAPPFKVAEFDIMYNEGISREMDLLDTAVDLDIVERRGAYYAFNDETIAQGKENTRQELKENSELFSEIAEKVKEAINGVPEENGGANEETSGDTPEG